MITIQMSDHDPILDQKSRIACGAQLIRFNDAGSHRDDDRLDSCPDPQFRTDLFQIAIDRAGRQPEDAANIARTLSARDPYEAFELPRAQRHVLRSDIPLMVWGHDLPRL